MYIYISLLSCFVLFLVKMRTLRPVLFFKHDSNTIRNNTYGLKYEVFKAIVIY